MTKGIDLGAVETSSELKYQPAVSGQPLDVNGSYMLGFFVSEISVADQGVKEGDFIRWKLDYAKTSKPLQFSKPVMIDDKLYADGIVTVQNEETLHFNGVTWQNNCSSTAPILDVGVFTSSVSKLVTFADLENSTFQVPLHLTIEISGACGGGQSQTVSNLNSGTGGSGGGYGAIEIIVDPVDGFPTIHFEAGTGGSGGSKVSTNAKNGGDSSLTINALKVIDAFGGIAGDNTISTLAEGGVATFHDVYPVLYSETTKGGQATATSSYSEEVSCKYRTISPQWNGASAVQYGGFTALGTRGGRGHNGYGGSSASGESGSAGQIRIAYRPATAEEIASWEALKA